MKRGNKDAIKGNENKKGLMKCKKPELVSLLTSSRKTIVNLQNENEKMRREKWKAESEATALIKDCDELKRKNKGNTERLNNIKMALTTVAAVNHDTIISKHPGQSMYHSPDGVVDISKDIQEVDGEELLLLRHLYRQVEW